MAQLNILDLLERKTSVTLNVAEEIIAKVIRHKWKGLHDATNVFTSAEDSGLGKFTTRDKKIVRRLTMLEIIIDNTRRALENDITEKERMRFERHLESFLDEKRYLETKI